MSNLIFNALATYYDLLYKNKPYQREAHFIDEILRECAPGASRIIDVGCGTGIHAWHFASLGYTVLGIDQSAAMLDIARARATLFEANARAPEFKTGKLQQFSVAEPYHVIVSLFDVVSYLRTYESVREFARNARGSLTSNGILIFDCWYGPAVYWQRPAPRVRRLENDEVEVTRVAESDFITAHNHIDVHYEIFVRRKSDGAIQKFREEHLVRCYFDDELDTLFGAAGFRRIFSMQWFSRAPASNDSWSALFGYQLI